MRRTFGASARTVRDVPRLIPRRVQKTDWPATPVPVSVPGRMRVRKTFACEGCTFLEGGYVMLDDPLVQRIADEYPGVFEPASRLAAK